MRIRMASVLIAVPALALANGGPADVSGIVSAGGLAPLRVPEVSLVSEDLRLTPCGDWMDVEAVYTLVNTGGDAAIGYGFPVDYADLPGVPGDSPWVPSALPRFAMTLDGRELEVVEVDDS